MLFSLGLGRGRGRIVSQNILHTRLTAALPASTATATETATATFCIICERVNYPNQVGEHAKIVFKAGLTPTQRGAEGVACVAHIRVAVVVVVVMSKRLKSVFGQKSESCSS